MAGTGLLSASTGSQARAARRVPSASAIHRFSISRTGRGGTSPSDVMRCLPGAGPQSVSASAGPRKRWRPRRRERKMGWAREIGANAGRRQEMARKTVVAAIVAIVAILIVLGLASDFLVDWVWFSSIGLFGVFWTIFKAKVLLFVAVFAVSVVLLGLNGALALRL